MNLWAAEATWSGETSRCPAGRHPQEDTGSTAPACTCRKGAGRAAAYGAGVDDNVDLSDALRLLQPLGSGIDLTQRIASLERSVPGRTGATVRDHLDDEAVTAEVLAAALAVKAVAGQINVIVHMVGILISLPYILRPGEVVEGLSLGAGNTGRSHDLETDQQVAEFKFIEWRGGAESIRQNNLFIDVFNLASVDTTKRRVMYVVGKEHPLRFLRNRRAISSVLSKNSAVQARFQALHGDRLATVSDYYATVEQQVELVDLRDLVPAFRGVEI